MHLSQDHKNNIRKAMIGKNTWMLGKKLSDTTKQKISEALTGRKLTDGHIKNISTSHFGFKVSEATKKKLSIINTGKKLSEETKIKVGIASLGRKNNLGKSWQQKKTLEFGYAEKQERNDPAYKNWRRQVWQRDGFKCKIKNKDCCGRIEAHHILGWSEHPELRYIINNGITLCHFHHPRKRSEEANLSPYFKELVANVK